MSDCRRWHISGRVQGVFFRDSTRTQALRLDLIGHAINLHDGRVEVFACGRREALDELEKWLQHGPPRARVDRVESAPAGDPPPSGFTIG